MMNFTINYVTNSGESAIPYSWLKDVSIDKAQQIVTVTYNFAQVLITGQGLAPIQKAIRLMELTELSPMSSSGPQSLFTPKELLKFNPNNNEITINDIIIMNYEQDQN